MDKDIEPTDLAYYSIHEIERGLHALRKAYFRFQKHIASSLNRSENTLKTCNDLDNANTFHHPPECDDNHCFCQAIYDRAFSEQVIADCSPFITTWALIVLHKQYLQTIEEHPHHFVLYHFLIEQNKNPSSMCIYYDNGSKAAFQGKFLKKKKAYIQLYYDDGSMILKQWQIKKFNKESNLLHNLTSGHLRKWHQKKIRHAVLSTKRSKLLSNPHHSG